VARAKRGMMVADNLVRSHALLLTAGIGGVLLAATLCGLTLKLILARRSPHALIDNLNLRVAAWWVIAAAVGAALVTGRIGTTVFFALASYAALCEFLRDMPRGRGDRAMRWAAIGVALPVQFACAGFGTYALFAGLVPAAVVAAAAILAACGSRATTANTLIGLLLCVYSISHIPALLALDIPGYAGRTAFLVLHLVLVTQASDVLQYIFGTLFGRHPLAPALSPGKTVEGYLGGIACATALGAGLAWITPFSAIEAAAISLVVTLLGAAGGLLFSAFKRRRGIKDWSSLIPGHGGVLDRLDSLCLSAPVYYTIVRLGWAA